MPSPTVSTGDLPLSTMGGLEAEKNDWDTLAMVRKEKTKLAQLLVTRHGAWTSKRRIQKRQKIYAVILA